MALSGLQNYAFPLTLLGEVTVNGDLNGKDVYVSGAVTGAGISTDILDSNNTWTGLNDFQNDAFYTGVLPPTNDNDMLTKEDIDDAKAAYDPIPTDNVWTVAPIFSNANPPTCPEVVSTDPENSLVGYQTAFNVGGLILTERDITKNPVNIWEGTQTFQNVILADDNVVPSLLIPTLPNQPACKAYIDGKIDVTGKAITVVINTPGTYNFSDASLTTGDLGAVGKIDYFLFSGSCGNASGSVVSGTLGNGGGVQGSIVVTCGQIADPAVVYTVQDQNLPSSTTLKVAGQIVESAFGACNLNGTLTPGLIGFPSVISTVGSSANGALGANNILAYSNLLGVQPNAFGGCIFVAYYT